MTGRPKIERVRTLRRSVYCLGRSVRGLEMIYPERRLICPWPDRAVTCCSFAMQGDGHATYCTSGDGRSIIRVDSSLTAAVVHDLRTLLGPAEALLWLLRRGGDERVFYSAVETPGSFPDVVRIPTGASIQRIRLESPASFEFDISQTGMVYHFVTRGSRVALMLSNFDGFHSEVALSEPYVSVHLSQATGELALCTSSAAGGQVALLSLNGGCVSEKHVVSGHHSGRWVQPGLLACISNEGSLTLLHCESRATQTIAVAEDNAPLEPAVISADGSFLCWRWRAPSKDVDNGLLLVDLIRHQAIGLDDRGLYDIGLVVPPCAAAC